jgi:hypothetical protein
MRGASAAQDRDVATHLAHDGGAAVELRIRPPSALEILLQYWWKLMQFRQQPGTRCRGRRRGYQPIGLANRRARYRHTRRPWPIAQSERPLQLREIRNVDNRVRRGILKDQRSPNTGVVAVMGTVPDAAVEEQPMSVGHVSLNDRCRRVVLMCQLERHLFGQIIAS